LGRKQGNFVLSIVFIILPQSGAFAILFLKKPAHIPRIADVGGKFTAYLAKLDDSLYLASPARPNNPVPIKISELGSGVVTG
jgi:hypothetical protein